MFAKIFSTNWLMSIRNFIWALANFGLLQCFSFYAFHKNFGLLFFGGDGGYQIIDAANRMKWQRFSFGFSSNDFQSLGNIQFPFNFMMLPEYVIPHFLLGSDLAYDPRFIVTVYAIIGAELFLSTLVLGRFLGLGWGWAVIAAWAMPLLALPYFGFPLLYPIMLLGPSYGTMIAEALLIVVLFGYIGRGDETRQGRYFREIPLVLLLLALVGHLLAWLPAGTMIWAPAALFLCLGMLLTASKQERKIKIVAMVVALLVLLVCGFPMFLLGILQYTVPLLLGAGALENSLGITDSTYISILYGHGGVGPFGPYVMILGVFGMVMAVFFGNRWVRGVAVGCLALIGAVFAAGWSALLWDFWRGPMPIYFEFGLWPFYAAFAAWGVAVLPAYLFRRYCHGWSAFVADSVAMHIIILVVPGIAFFYAWPVENRIRQFVVPPSKPPLVATLQEQIGLAVGKPFRGRVATMESLDVPGPINWMEWVNKDWPRYAATGNEYHWNGFWAHGIPTLFEYSPLISPAFFKAVVRLLGRSEDKHQRNIFVLRRPDARILGLFGVHYVVTDGQLQAPFRLVLTEKTHKEEVLSLYEVPEVNIGDWSPTEIARVQSFDEALNRIDDVGFDGRKTALVFDSDDSGLKDLRLVPAKDPVIRMWRGGFSVEAKSDGESLLVLPFEFSHCRSIRKLRSGSARLVRVNAIETGIIFSGTLTADIEYFSGPFRNSRCRLADASALSRLMK